MEPRKIIIGTYDTALEGLWTLNSCHLGSAPFNEAYVKVPGHSGPLDLSTVLTDGEPYYDSRPFTARLESSVGTRLERENRINYMINKLDGWRFNIILPDDPTHYITGRVSITKEFNNLAHAAVTVKATCDPWRYNAAETVVGITASEDTEQHVVLINAGRKSVVPRIQITGGPITLKREGWSKVFSEGTPPHPDIYLQSGSTVLTYIGTGSAIFTYREAVL